VVPVLNKAPCHEEVLGVEVWRHSFLTSALGGGKWLASWPGRFTPKERAPGTHWIGGWVDVRAGLDAVVKRQTARQRREIQCMCDALITVVLQLLKQDIINCESKRLEGSGLMIVRQYSNKGNHKRGCHGCWPLVRDLPRTQRNGILCKINGAP
jgi:hypothetical protein